MRIDGPTYGAPADTHPLGEVYTVRIPEPAFEPDDWPTREELADE